MTTEAIAAAHSARLATIDALLPESPAPEPDSAAGEWLTATAGESAAAGFATRTQITGDSPVALWRTLVEHRLDVQLCGTEPEEAFGAVLTQWDEHLRMRATPGDLEAAAVVARPSRDSAGAAELLRHGFAPVLVIAARPADRLGAGPPTTPGVCIRPAEPGDLPTVVHLQWELQRYDAQFGTVTLRDNAEQLITTEQSALLARDEPRMWIAELYGQPLGLIHVQLPGETGWISDRVAAGRVGYLSSLAVAEAARSTGVGTALTAHAHQVFDEAGADVVLLHHALANPRSTPFWYAQGYRPLWTYWQRRPAVRR
ncbi:GNAT family N-acetyltransferase [Amycolatopsis sp. H20-H5]|uniref:GNAT family N-acetyltransferase n=1 Tax=Amycolatopsis sp. H20-H5 TaxID=3046309 RepID=UPI002DB600F5|nr:GNAT family N-acetyltransferase [Amycolatopsis sp. H20-H5]MEC3976510.1 GNAT family N-acetyltransferase [Amycolatopsis sp. H20-H5]